MITTLADLLTALSDKPQTVRCEGGLMFLAENAGLVQKHQSEKGEIQWSITAEGIAQRPVAPVDIEGLKKKQKAAKAEPVAEPVKPVAPKAPAPVVPPKKK